MKMAEEVESFLGELFEGWEILVGGDGFVIKVPKSFN